MKSIAIGILENTRILSSDKQYQETISEAIEALTFDNERIYYRIKQPPKHELNKAAFTSGDCEGWYVVTTKDCSLYLNHNLEVVNECDVDEHTLIWPTEAEANQARDKYLGKEMEPEIKVGSHWERITQKVYLDNIICIDSVSDTKVTWGDFNKTLLISDLLKNFKPRPDLDQPTVCNTNRTKFKVNISVDTRKHIDHMINAGYSSSTEPHIGYDYMYVNTATKKFELSYDQVAFANSDLPCRTVYEIVEPQPTTKEQPMNKLDLRLLTAIMQLIATAEDEQLDATNSTHIVVVTKDGEYEGYFYADGIEQIQQAIQEPKNELKKFHVFDYSNTFAQKPRKIIEVSRN